MCLGLALLRKYLTGDYRQMFPLDDLDDFLLRQNLARTWVPSWSDTILNWYHIYPIKPYNILNNQ